jgi:N-acetyl-anhydromuramyl-L-alanine amidase AmpD
MNAQKFATAQFFIDKSGQIFEVTPAEYRGNHVAGMQEGSVGIEIEGFPERHGETTPENMATPEQDAAAALLGVYLINRYPTINQALSHREVGLYDHDMNSSTPLKRSGKTDGWTALRAFRSLVGQTGYDMGKRNNTDTFMGHLAKGGYFLRRSVAAE